MGSDTIMKHSIIGASSFDRIMKCHGSVRMTKDKSSETNPSAELGTAAHELSEFCLLFNVHPKECLGMEFNKHKVDDSMIEGVDVYVNFVKDLCSSNNVVPMIEKRVTISTISKDMFGTSDCIIIIGKTLYVLDYKNGRGVVEAEDNKQGIFYGLGSLDTFNLWSRVDKVIIGIIQPNADHLDGSIRTCEYSIERMLLWHKVYSEVYNYAMRTDSKLKAGSHCQYCLASAECRPRLDRTLDLIYGEKPLLTLNENEIVEILNEIAAIKTNCKTIEKRALELVQSGKTIEGYKLVKGIKRASCVSEDEFVKSAIEFKPELNKNDFYDLKLKSMTKCKKLVDYNLVDKFFVKPEAGVSLVKFNDRRPAISNQPSATGRFKNITE